MQPYLDILSQVHEHGQTIPARNATTIELFGIAARYHYVGDQFPLLTTKKMAFKAIVGELLAFLRGYDDVKEFKRLGCNVWDKNATSESWKANPNYQKDYLGRIYGVQWRDYTVPAFGPNGEAKEPSSLDQIKLLIELIKKDKHSRRLVVTAWNPGEIEEMCLPPCHVLWQCNVDANNQLNILMFQRSADMFLGVPFNIASYSLLILILAKLTGCKPGSLIHMIGSAHIYENALDAVTEQLTRLPGAPCQVELKDRGQTNVEDFEPSDFSLIGYHPQDAITGVEMII